MQIDFRGLMINSYHGNQFSKKRKCDIIEFMTNNGITEYFEEVEITREYDGYYSRKSTFFKRKIMMKDSDDIG